MSISKKDILIVGAGFAGLGAAIKLIKAGITNISILEKGTHIGGTWRDNTYPGCGCDVKSHLYSFSFYNKSDWSNAYAKQPEILAYIKQMCSHFKLESYIEFECDITSMSFNDDQGSWTVTDRSGKIYQSRIVISATGPLNIPNIPNIEGLASYEGTAFHSSEWNHNIDLTDQSVAVVGTGASAIQFVPQIAHKVKELTIFQRTAPWILPKPDKPYTSFQHFLFKYIPFARCLHREHIYWFNEFEGQSLFKDGTIRQHITGISKRHIKRHIKDPELRKKVTPIYDIGCKRRLPSNDYYPSLTLPHVHLVTEGLQSVDGNQLITKEGTYQADILIFATGFHVTDFSRRHLNVQGLNDRLLQQEWRMHGLTGYWGCCVNGFPNFLTMLGPNTGLGHTSQLHIMESQFRFIVKYCKKILRASNIIYVDVRKDAQDSYNKEIQSRLKTTVWNTGGCNSWYLNEQQKNTTLWPGHTFEYRKKLKRIQWNDFTIRKT